MPPISLLLAFTAIFALLIVVLYQRRAVTLSKDEKQQIASEKETVIKLMDSIGERMTRGIDLTETLELIAKYIVGATHAESGAIYLLNESDNTLKADVVVGLFPPLFEDKETQATRNRYMAGKIREHPIPADEGIIGTALKAEKPILVIDAEADPRVPRDVSSITPVHSIILSPLRVRGRNLGVLVVVNKLGDSVFDARDTVLLQALADQAAVTVDLVKLYDVLARQQRMEQELDVARDFQGMLLPRSVPKVPGYEFAALNHSALMVGGDFYDFMQIDRNHLGIVIADVSGKGIPGALIMASVRATLRAEARETLSPRTVLRRVNERMLEETRENVFVTITYGILDIPNMRLRLVRAGHEPILLVRDGEVTADADRDGAVHQINPTGMAVGLMPSQIFEKTEEVELQLQPGDLLILNTDGVIEAINGDSEEFGRPRLLKLLGTLTEASAEEANKTILDAIEDFSRGIPQHDDITLVAVKVLPEPDAEADRV